MIGSESFVAYGLFGIFVWSILESAILPVPAEIVIIPLSPYYSPFLIALVGGIGSVFGCLFDYYIGLKNVHLLPKYLGGKRLERGKERFKVYEKYGRWGVYGALFIGRVVPSSLKPLYVAAGLFRLNIIAFIIIAFISSVIRYLIAALIGKTLLGILF